MADATVLEKQEAVSEAEREHDGKIAENYQRLMGDRSARDAADYSSQSSYTQNDYEASPVRQFFDYGIGNTAAAAAPAYREERQETPVSAVPSAAKRLADYVPITVGMKKIQRIGDMPSYSSERVSDYAPVSPVKEEAPAENFAPAAPARTPLFENLTYRNGQLLESEGTDLYGAPSVYASASPAYAPEKRDDAETEISPILEPQYDPSYTPAEEDAMPTYQTMQTLQNMHAEAQEKSTGLFAALSTKAKVALAVVATVIAILIALVCINTAMLNSLNASIEYRQAQAEELAEEAADIRSAIAEITDSENIADWAIENGMTRAEG